MAAAPEFPEIEPQPAPLVQLVIRSPMFKQGDMRLRVPLGSNVARIKAEISKEHDDHPEPDEQRLIFAGRLLSDEMNALDLVKQHDLKESIIFHLMTSPKKDICSPSTLDSQPPSAGAGSSTSHAAPAAAGAAGASSEAVAATVEEATPRAAVTASSASQPLLHTPMPQIPALQPHAEPHIYQPHAEPHIYQPLRSDTAPQSPSPSSTTGQPATSRAPSFPQLPPHLPNQQLLWTGAGYMLVAQEMWGQPYVFCVPTLPMILGDMVYMPSPTAPAPTPLAPGASAGWPNPLAPTLPSILSPGPATAPEAPAAAEPPQQQPQPAAAAGAEMAQGAPPPPLMAAGGMVAGGLGAMDGGGGDREALLANGEEENADPIKLLLKLALFVYILSQDGAPHRLYLLSASAVLIFLAQTGRLEFLRRFAERQLAPPPPPPAPIVAHNDADADADAVADADADADGAARDAPLADAAGAAGEAPAPPRRLIRDIQNVVVAFVTSLLPS